MIRWKVGWAALVGCALGAAVVTARLPARSFSLSCSKTQELHAPDLAHADATCASSTLYAFGLWPPIQIFLVLAVPAIVAGVVARRWVSALAAVAYVVSIGCGVIHWDSWLIVLLPAGALLAVLALVLTLLQPTRA
ncbi:hypothetical protein GII30_00080 [Gordonia amarae]|nr:hypothetical protein [Gordonia amarae]MCS3876731.1 hypothetical protein [Gordonia amarae]QHN15587.1 hypothetical protein GII35_00080 [Gordonia amarae]QHN20157.1 hypothetical protein GII34_00080 [Gordonia amarae]QHN29007.1 hypothetical protein GII32_00080 [Gordonia amarae]QHN37788.1 hypothetical protein GII30_00080 [Gordonia amarae]